MKNQNQVVLITGGSSGMGRETAKLLNSQGYLVYAAARRVERMRDLEALGIRVMMIDVTDEKSIQSVVSAILKEQGRIDVLINNAGFGLMGPVEDVILDQARHQMEVNVFGLIRLTQLVIPTMRAQNSGTIVNLSSTAGKLSSPLVGWYSASKYAVEALSDSLRLELKQFGIKVIIIEPGGVKSEWTGIAMKGLSDITQNSPYISMARKIIEFSQKSEAKNASPEVISRLILNSLTKSRPKARYHGGHMSGLLLFLKKVLSDAQFDWLLLKQLK